MTNKRNFARFQVEEEFDLNFFVSGIKSYCILKELGEGGCGFSTEKNIENGAKLLFLFEWPSKGLAKVEIPGDIIYQVIENSSQASQKYFCGAYFDENHRVKLGPFIEQLHNLNESKSINRRSFVSISTKEH